MQYHSNIEKSLGRSLYETFVARLEEEVKKNKKSQEYSVRWGTYGNRQVLSLETYGPFTHVIDL